MKLKTVLSFDLPQYKKPSRCESCGEDFTCGAALEGCWCAEIRLTEEARNELKTKFQNCLCRNCLEQYAFGAGKTK